jgi:hypothetical protein
LDTGTDLPKTFIMQTNYSILDWYPSRLAASLDIPKSVLRIRDELIPDPVFDYILDPKCRFS